MGLRIKWEGLMHLPFITTIIMAIIIKGKSRTTLFFPSPITPALFPNSFNGNMLPESQVQTSETFLTPFFLSNITFNPSGKPVTSPVKISIA